VARSAGSASASRSLLSRSFLAALALGFAAAIEVELAARGSGAAGKVTGFGAPSRLKTMCGSCSGPPSSLGHTVAAPVNESWIGPRSGRHASSPFEGGRPGARAARALVEGAARAGEFVEETSGARGSGAELATFDGALADALATVPALPFLSQEASAISPNAAHDRHAIPLHASLRLAPPGPFWHGPAMSWLKARGARALGLTVLSTLGVACGPPSAPPLPPRPTTKAEKPAPPPAASQPQNPAFLPSQVLARVDDENASVYFAQRGGDALIFYAAKQRWLTRAIAADGSAKGKEALDVGEAPEGAKAVLKAVGDGYLAVWIEPVARNHAIKALSLDEQGKPRGEATLVTQVTEELSMVDLLPAGQGALVLWEVQRDDHSDLLVIPLEGSKPSGAPIVVARDVMGWEPASNAKGAAIATVVASVQQASTPGNGGKGKKKKAPDPEAEAAEPRGSALGAVQLIELDDKGHPGAPIAVSNELSAQVDVELAVAGGKYILAWTDERHLDPCVYTAVVEPGGKLVQAPRRATVPFGEQALVALIDGPHLPGGPGTKRALLAWEDLLRTPPEGRLIHLATLGADGALGKERASILFSASGRPEIVPDGEGFAAMTLAPVPELLGAEDSAEDAAPSDGKGAIKGAALRKREIPVLPFYARFGADLAVLGSEPILAAPFPSHDFATDGSPYLTRALACSGGACYALASGLVADKAQGAPLATVALPVRKSRWKPAAQRDPDETPPRPESIAALFDGDHLSDVSGAELPAGGSLSAWVTYYLDGATNRPKKKGKKDEEGPFATLALRAIAADGTPGKTAVISRKALSVGGVAMAPIEIEKGGEKKAETAIAWVARDKGEPQVYVTKVDAQGNKLAQKGLTVINRKKAKGGLSSEVSDVAITADGNDGWIVAWVDTRDNNSEIYVAKVDRSLTKVVPDRRISEAAGDSVEVQLVARGKDVFVVWADARQSPSEGTCDIYLARLEASSLKKVGVESRLFASALHSRSPQIGAAGSGYLVSWIEDSFGEKADSSVATAERGLRVAQLDARGTMIGVPTLVRGEQGAPVTAHAVACRAKGCRAVITSAVGESLLMGAFELVPGQSAGPLKTIATLTGPVTEDVSPIFAGQSASSLFFADNAVGGSGRVRWMQIGWP
jgi:hypothetical protein